MTTEHEASRTLVKSPPELWAELSDEASLARHIGKFKDIRITKLEPETAVAWEGERASGTVRLEPSGWGTKVSLSAKVAAAGPPADAAPAAAASEQPEAAAPAKPAAAAPAVSAEAAPAKPAVAAPPSGAASGAAPGRRRGGLLGRLLGWLNPPAPAAPETPAAPAARAAASAPAEATLPTPSDPPEPPTPPSAPSPPAPAGSPPDLDPEVVLAAALDSLGQAHHRPFSRG
jgi:hypothetical protein